MNSTGRNQREAVNVIFRLFASLADGDMQAAEGHLTRISELDASGVNSPIVVAARAYIASSAEPESAHKLLESIRDSPYESAGRFLETNFGKS